MPALFNGLEVLSSASDKAKFVAENFSKNSNVDDSSISLPVFPSKTNLKLHNISVTPKMVKKVVMNLDLSKASGPDLLTVVSDRIAWAFNRSGASRAISLNISKALDRVWHAGLHKVKSYGISGRIFSLISSFLSNRQLRVVLNDKSSHEHSVNAGVPPGFILAWSYTFAAIH